MANSTETLQNSLLQALREAADWESDNLDAYIIRYFGSVERAKELIKYYVIEEDPMRMEIDEQLGNPYATYRMTHTYRIRPKTPEELAHDRAEEIIEKNTRPNCIVCKEPVQKDDLVESHHGPYHTWCLDGHP